METAYEKHTKKRRSCEFLERFMSSDHVTCTHNMNETAIKVCSHEHCPVQPLPVECVAKQYTIKVDLLVIMDSDAWLENENQWEASLAHMLDKIPGVTNVDYNGHFGNYVWLTIESEHDNEDTWDKIQAAIYRSYNWPIKEE